jgi:peptidoglycan/LPS O-acetylase OafA/YrhL
LLAGIVVLCPLIKYVELRSGISMSVFGLEYLDAPFEESFVRFLPTFYSGLDRFTWSHLWFLAYLLTFTLLYARPLRRLADDSSRMATVSTLGLYRPLILLVAIQTTLRLVWPGGLNLVNDWANFAYYSTFFVVGFVFARQPAWNEVIDREWKRAGTIGLATSVALGAFLVARSGRIFPSEPTVTSVLAILPALAGSAVAGYCLVIAMLGFARRHLTRSSPFLAYLAESSLPIYVIHQPAVVVSAYYVVGLDAGIAAKYGLVLTTSTASALAIHHTIIRRSPTLRMLLGMKPMTTGARSSIGRTALDARADSAISARDGSTSERATIAAGDAC